MQKIKRLLRYDWPLHFVLLLTNWLSDNVPLMLLRGTLVRPFLNFCGPGVSLGRSQIIRSIKEAPLMNELYLPVHRV